MNQATVVSGFECFGNLARDAERIVQGHATRAKPGEQRFAVDVFEDEEQCAVLVAEFEYAYATALQASEDRARVSSYFLATAGSMALALVGMKLDARPEPLVTLGFAALFALLTGIGLLTLNQLAALRLAFGVADLALCRRRHRRALMMTREEVRRDEREEEGDPRLRAERDRLRRAAVLAGPVASAACVVVNPTHLAVALGHDRAADEAPRVLARGAGREAARIRTAARRAGVPVVRDPPLARALFRLAGVGEVIPRELFEAAAAVLAQVYRLAEGRR